MSSSSRKDNAQKTSGKATGLFAWRLSPADPNSTDSTVSVTKGKERLDIVKSKFPTKHVSAASDKKTGSSTKRTAGSNAPVSRNPLFATPSQQDQKDSDVLPNTDFLTMDMEGWNEVDIEFRRGVVFYEALVADTNDKLGKLKALMNLRHSLAHFEKAEQLGHPHAAQNKEVVSQLIQILLKTEKLDLIKQELDNPGLFSRNKVNPDYEQGKKELATFIKQLPNFKGLIESTSSDNLMSLRKF